MTESVLDRWWRYVLRGVQFSTVENIIQKRFVVHIHITHHISILLHSTVLQVRQYIEAIAQAYVPIDSFVYSLNFIPFAKPVS